MGKKTYRGGKGIIKKRLRNGYVVHLAKCPLDKRPKMPIDKCICRVESENGNT